MANYSLVNLLEKIKNTSLTSGFDAVVFYNRAMINRLLAYQFIENYKDSSYSAPISPTVKVSDTQYLDIKGAVLGPPLISFNTANFEDSTATVTYEFISGSVFSRVESTDGKPDRIKELYTITPNNRRTVTMTVHLKRGQGSVSNEGAVIFDLGEAIDVVCDMVNNPIAQAELGKFFEDMFMAYPDKYRIWEIGKVDLSLADVFAPDKFHIRTLPSGEAGKAGDYDEGAVVLFIIAKANLIKDRLPPLTWDHPYMIPNDDLGDKYSAAVIVSSEAVLRYVIKPKIEEWIADDLALQIKVDATTERPYLEAVAGVGEVYGDKIYEEECIGLNFHTGYMLIGGGPVSYYTDSPLRVYFDGGKVSLAWKNKKSMPLHIHYKKSAGAIVLDEKGPEDMEYDINFDIAAEWALTRDEEDPTLFTINNTSLSYSSARDEEPFRWGNWKPVDPGDKPCYWAEYGKFWSRVENYLQISDNDLPSVGFYKLDRSELAFPGLKFIAITDLLFPGEHILTLPEFHQPGDLYLAGQIDPAKTSMQISPLMPMVISEGKTTLTVTLPADLVGQVAIWDVKVTATGKEPLVGTATFSVTNTGGTIEYTAPAISSAMRNIITITRTSDKTTVHAVALVTVVMDKIVISPYYATRDLDDLEEPVLFKAESVISQSYSWALEGTGKIAPSTSQCTYTPPESVVDTDINWVTVKDGASNQAKACVVVMGKPMQLNIKPTFATVRPGGEVQFIIEEGTGEVTGEAPNAVTWEVLSGSGTIDANGLYTAPATLDYPFAIIAVTLTSGSKIKLQGMATVYLSNNAVVSRWQLATDFQFTVNPTSEVVWSNGLQQYKVTVKFKPDTEKNGYQPISDTERDSICLAIAAEGRLPMTVVKKDEAVPAGTWGYCLEPNSYLALPTWADGRSSVDDDSGDPGEGFVVKDFYVQCNSADMSTIQITAGVTPDGAETIWANTLSEGNNPREITLKAAPGPIATTTENTLAYFNLKTAERVQPDSGASDNGDTLNSLDYYECSLMLNSAQAQIFDLGITGNRNMVKWESQTGAEDVHSLVGYALERDYVKDEGDLYPVHHIDSLLRDKLPAPPADDPDFNFSSPLPEAHLSTKVSSTVNNGRFWFTLQRRQGWKFDPEVNTAYNKDILLTPIDAYGNRHVLTVKMARKDADEVVSDRNFLIIK